MASSAIDSELFGAFFAPPAYRDIFSDRNRVQKWLDIERVLAEVQAEIGMIPAAAAAEIARHCDAAKIDLSQIGAGVAATAHPLVPALRIVEGLCADGLGEFIHYGATTQDIMDTGIVLQVKEAWPLLKGDLGACRTALAALAGRHRATVMVGRTHGQQALPITFGFKVAVWIDEIDRHLERMTEAEPRLFVGNLTGAVGTMASFDGHGRRMQREVLTRLGLGTPRICWHAARDRYGELAFLMTQISSTLAKIANQIYTLQQIEFDELAEPHPHGKVGSSTMPHKRNPALMELTVGLGRLVRAKQVALTDALLVEHERDVSCNQVERTSIPEMMIYVGAMLTHMRYCFEGLEVKPARMRANADLLGGLLLSERVMLALGRHIGKQTAHEVVYEIAMQAFEASTPFKTALLADPRVAAHLDAETITSLLDPADYIGEAVAIVDDVIGG
ncbi:MAG: adenylosuccinate lyase [Hyphomicrobiaceae bacterium]|nr:adenylosuccinate lyase [Hyphomicrobiaceae bacterium]